ncbi:hypothetical protein TrLO_g10448 [Triparma laevis f. longispina]|uniref:AAA+ ATPase domain-containing protein n=1 Tax=Triparma laevis f. longispina TaxID=1714387 RepID=A0A9W7C4H3_9STRA|nr:hypothetical protein TrLO_g10448 [Triparma laevis f. longispina]
MFGRKKQPEPERPSSVLNTPAPSSGNSVTGFDPSALERAAKAARELDASKNSKSAVELIKVQETTKQHEAATKRAEYDAMSQQMQLQRAEKEGEEARKTLERKSQYDRDREDYKDKLDRKKLVDQLQAQKEMQEAGLKRQEEGVLKQEKLRRQTLEYEAELRQKTELARVKAETDGKIKQERVNHDLLMEKLKVEAKEKKEAMIQSVKDGMELAGKGINNFLTDKEKLRNTAFTVSALAVGIYTAKVGTGVLGRFIEANLGKPSLVRDTSRITVSQFLSEPIKSGRQILGFNDAKKALEGIVLEKNLSTQLEKIAVATSNTKKNRAPFRHLMLHGPPGTGKTMFARNLAQNSGLEYAILTGGDVAPLGRDAVTEIHKLFDWAHTSRKGLLLFVDEADAFLRNRETEAISEDVRNALNAFLYRTGTETDKFMMVYASNKPSQFDGAITDRIDEMVEFGLPGVEERRNMVNMYIDKYLKTPAGAWSKKVVMEGITEDDIEAVVLQTEGWSGREISKLAIAWQSAAYGSEGAVIDAVAFKAVVEQQSRSNKLKGMWLDEALAEKMARDK